MAITTHTSASARFEVMGGNVGMQHLDLLFDVIGKTHWLLDETRVELLCALVEKGYEDHLLISSDRCREVELKANGGPGYDHVLRQFVPRLREAGFDDDLLRRILVENPTRVLAFEPQDG